VAWRWVGQGSAEARWGARPWPVSAWWAGAGGLGTKRRVMEPCRKVDHRGINPTHTEPQPDTAGGHDTRETQPPTKVILNGAGRLPTCAPTARVRRSVCVMSLLFKQKKRKEKNLLIPAAAESSPSMKPMVFWPRAGASAPAPLG